MAEVHRLDRELRTVTARAAIGASAARARQLRWVAGELILACDHPDFPLAATRSVVELLGPTGIAAYLDLARAGALRRRAVAGDPQATDASMRIRADCLKLLGGAMGQLVDVPDRPGLPQLHTPVDGPSRSQLREFLAARVRPTGSPPGRVRLLAIVGVVLDTGARVGEMCAIRMADLAPDLGALRVERHPQARTSAPVATETIPLGTGTRIALRDWLDVRSEIVAPLQGSADALWVSVRPNHAGVPNADGYAITRPPGMPLRPRGLQRAYTRAVTEANDALVGSPGWIPLPHRFEQLRRAVSVSGASTAATS